jgi:hypothetical protein
MKDQSKNLETSRRQFAKAAAAALVALPFVSNTMGAQQKVARKRKATLLRLPIPPQAQGFQRRPSPGVEEHIPPMTLSDGSLEINLYERFDIDDGEQIGEKRWLYKKSSFGKIKKAMVMVTNEEDFITPYYSLFGPPFCNLENFQLKLWLQEKESASNAYKPISMSNPPDVIIGGDGMLQMEINEKLTKPSKSKHPYRPYKYEHQGESYSQHFRVGAIELNSTTCGLSRWITRDFDHYRIQIFGPDIDPNKLVQ